VARVRRWRESRPVVFPSSRAVAGPVDVWLISGKPLYATKRPSRDPRATKRRILPEEGQDPWRRWRLAVSCLEHRYRTVYYFHEERDCDTYRTLALHAICEFAHFALPTGDGDRA
jgi:hypothetical protein